jgi:hypothetical protein
MQQCRFYPEFLRLLLGRKGLACERRWLPRCLQYRLTTASLDTYYSFLHPCFPILPPPVTAFPSDQSIYGNESGEVHCSESPLSYAVAGLVAIGPKSFEDRYTTINSRAARYENAEHYIQLALRSIDRDMDSTGSPARNRFHPGVPVHLEVILATLLVAVYEYCYRGKLTRARTRMASVIIMAMDQRLHDITLEVSNDLACYQRTWSMIVSSKQAEQPRRTSNESCRRFSQAKSRSSITW